MNESCCSFQIQCDYVCIYRTRSKTGGQNSFLRKETTQKKTHKTVRSGTGEYTAHEYPSKLPFVLLDIHGNEEYSPCRSWKDTVPIDV